MRFVLDAMAEGEAREGERWTKMFEKRDMMSQRLQEIEEVQQQLIGQADLAAAMAEQAAKERETLSKQVVETGKVVAAMRLEKMADEMEKLSEDLEHVGADFGHRSSRRAEQRDIGQNHSRDRSPRYLTECLHRRRDEGGRHQLIPKLQFSVFHGENPIIWLDKCLDYFKFYKVREGLWVTAASMHMEGNAAR